MRAYNSKEITYSYEIVGESTYLLATRYFVQLSPNWVYGLRSNKEPNAYRILKEDSVSRQPRTL